MLRKIGAALVAAMLVAAPALAIETQPPAASPIAKSKKVSASTAKKLAKSKAIGRTSKAIGRTSTAAGKTAGTHRQRPAKISTTTGAKANQVVATKKSNQNATVLPAKSKSKIAKLKNAKPKSATSNQANSNSANSKQAKSTQVKSQQVKRMPADATGSVAPRSVPTPGLY